MFKEMVALLANLRPLYQLTLKLQQYIFALSGLATNHDLFWIISLWIEQ